MSGASLDEILWQTVIGTCGSTKIEPSCQLFLQAWISNGIQRMQDEHRTKQEDIHTANNNLKTFVEMMKSEANAVGAAKLDNKAFHAAERALGRRSLITVFSLWPFWPHAVSG
jgi:hypothetical protein